MATEPMERSAISDGARYYRCLELIAKRLQIPRANMMLQPRAVSFPLRPVFLGIRIPVCGGSGL